MSAKPAEKSIRAGTVELVQNEDGTITLRFAGKAGVVQVKTEAQHLERWAKRQMREGVFA